MDEVPTQPPVVPPPDLGPPPSTPVAPSQVPPTDVPPVAVKIRQRPDSAGDDGDEPRAGMPAPFNSRIIAALIDAVVAAGLYLAVTWLLPGFAARLAWLVAMGYWVVRDSVSWLGGQSVGKKAMNLKVVTLAGDSLVDRWEPTLIRNLVLAIPLFFLVELFVLLSRENQPGPKRRLGDEWAKTQVVTAPPPPAAT